MSFTIENLTGQNLYYNVVGSTGISGNIIEILPNTTFQNYYGTNISNDMNHLITYPAGSRPIIDGPDKASNGGILYIIAAKKTGNTGSLTTSLTDPRTPPTTPPTTPTTPSSEPSSEPATSEPSSKPATSYTMYIILAVVLLLIIIYIFFMLKNKKENPIMAFGNRLKKMCKRF